MTLPSTPEEVIAFIGHNYCAIDLAARGENVRFTLTVHDLLSAFAELQDTQPASPAPEAMTDDKTPWCVQCGDQITAHDPGICGCCFATKYDIEPTVEQAISALVTALAESKGWMRDYADSVVRDAVDRKPEAMKCSVCDGRGCVKAGAWWCNCQWCAGTGKAHQPASSHADRAAPAAPNEGLSQPKTTEAPTLAQVAAYWQDRIASNRDGTVADAGGETK